VSEFLKCVGMGLVGVLGVVLLFAALFGGAWALMWLGSEYAVVKYGFIAIGGVLFLALVGATIRDE
jgi:hypothetical protein